MPSLLSIVILTIPNGAIKIFPFCKTIKQHQACYRFKNENAKKDVFRNPRIFGKPVHRGQRSYKNTQHKNRKHQIVKTFIGPHL